MIKIILILLSIAIAAMMSAVMDKLQFHFKTSIFARWNPLFWNPAISWQNKYKNGDPKQGPKFIGSTSFLVSLTDGWHLAKKIFTASVAVPITFAVDFVYPLPGIWWVAVWIGAQVVFGATFHAFFHWLFVLKSAKA